MKTDSDDAENISEKIEQLCAGLVYISETDAEIKPFDGEKAEAATAEELRGQLHLKDDAKIEETDFTQFFERLTAIKDWYGPEEKNTAEKFAALREFLRSHLNGVKVFKVGKIQIDVYVVGLDGEGKLRGITTKAVET